MEKTFEKRHRPWTGTNRRRTTIGRRRAVRRPRWTTTTGRCCRSRTPCTRPSIAARWTWCARCSSTASTRTRAATRGRPRTSPGTLRAAHPAAATGATPSNRCCCRRRRHRCRRRRRRHRCRRHSRHRRCRRPRRRRRGTTSGGSPQPDARRASVSK